MRGDAWKEVWSVEFLCRIMQVTSRGFRAWRVRPMSKRQRGDMVFLAHIREQHRLGLQSYGRPRMTEELQESGLNVGHRRVGRLMRENDIKVVRTQKYIPLVHCSAIPCRSAGHNHCSLSHILCMCCRAAGQAIAKHSAERGDSDHTFNIAPNLLDQDFSAHGPNHRPNQKWAGDISYIWTSEGWLYLAVILDLYSRRVIG